MWSHWKIEARLQALEENALAPPQRAALLQHLEHCPRCAAQWQQQQEVKRTLQAAIPPAPFLPSGAADALFLRAMEQSGTPAPPPFTRTATPRRVIGSALAGAALTLALLGYHALRPARPGAPTQDRNLSQRPKAGTALITASLARKTRRSEAPLMAPTHRAANDVAPHTALRLRTRPANKTPFAPATATPRTDDLAYVNVNSMKALVRATGLPEQEQQRWKADIERTIRRGDDFARIPFPQIAGRGLSSLRAAASAYRQQREIVDTRLAYRVTLAVKGVSFATLCERLTQETGVTLTAGKSVADDKVTIFCTRRPLRDLMRQISRHFGFVWRRDADTGRYEYELAQEIGAQLTEEELRNKDRDEALRALDQQMEAYRPYRNLTLQQLQEQATKDPDAAKKINLFGLKRGGLVPAQLYFSLTPPQVAALYGGQAIRFKQTPEEGALALPENLNTTLPVYFEEDAQAAAKRTGEKPTYGDFEVTLQLDKSEAGQFSLKGELDASETFSKSYSGIGHGLTLATGLSPSASAPANAATNNALAKDAAFGGKASIAPAPSCLFTRGDSVCFLSDDTGKKITTADVMEAIHKATGQDIVADYFTHIYDPSELTPPRDATLFSALNWLSDRMGMRWSREEGCLNFRSLRFFHDRVKEIPDRLLERWADSRRKNKRATLSDYVEIAKLTDAQLDSDVIAAGVMAGFGLQEWELGRSQQLRPHLRFLGQLSQVSRQAAQEAGGVAFEQLPLGQRLQFAALAFDTPRYKKEPDFDLLSGATLRVEFDGPETPSNKPALGNGNLVRFVYANKERWQATYGPFNAITHLP